MIKLLVPLKRLHGEGPRDFVQGAEQRPHELHPPHGAQKPRRHRVQPFLARFQPDAQKPAQDLGVPRFVEPVAASHELHVFPVQGRTEILDALEEDDDLRGA